MGGTTSAAPGPSELTDSKLTTGVSLRYHVGRIPGRTHREEVLLLRLRRVRKWEETFGYRQVYVKRRYEWFETEVV